MSGKSFSATALVAVALLMVGSAAQENELAGGLGRTFVADQGIQPGSVVITNNIVHFGNGTTFEANYARHLMGKGFFRLDGEIPVVGNPDEDLASGNGSIPPSYSAYFVTPSARVKFFANSAIEPWLSLGGGYGHFYFGKTQIYGGINPGPSTKNTGLLQTGVGLDVKPWERIGLRLAARDFWSGALPLNVNTGKSHQHNIVVTGGIFWRF